MPDKGHGIERAPGVLVAEEGDVRVRIPLPAMERLPVPDGAAGTAAALVGAFVRATAELPDTAAARLAAVRPETLRGWRRRLPRWLRADTARRLAAHLAGQAPAPAPHEAGFRRAFHLALRAVPPE